MVLVLVLLAASLAMHRPAFESLLFAVALAVGLTPEFLPMITTVTLAQGASRMADEHVIVKHLAAIQNLGSIDVLCSDKTGTLTVGDMSVEGSYGASGKPDPRPLALARLNSRFETGIRSPLDAAILAASVDGDDEGWNKLDEIPFDFERRRLSVVVERGTERLLVTKGAPDGICTLCAGTEEDHAFWRQWIARGWRERHAAAGRRDALTGNAIGVDGGGRARSGARGISHVLGSTAPRGEGGRRGDAERRRTGQGPDGRRRLRRAARRASVGLDPGEVLTGDEIDRMTDGALAQVAERTTVFARTSPAHKTRILLALKARGHVVGFMGDGINDAPSLHAADVGIAAPHAVDVAREASDILLTERGLAVLHGGILAGRRAFGNVMKYLLMGTSSNFGNMLSMAAASLLLPVSADAADADPAQQPALRRLADHDPDRRGGQ